jgi:hypothetical protein
LAQENATFGENVVPKIIGDSSAIHQGFIADSSVMRRWFIHDSSGIHRRLVRGSSAIHFRFALLPMNVRINTAK